MIKVEKPHHLKLHRKGVLDINNLRNVGFDRTTQQDLFHFLMGLNRSSSKPPEASEVWIRKEMGGGIIESAAANNKVDRMINKVH